VPVRRGHFRGQRRGLGVTPWRILVVQGWLRLRVLILRALLADAVGSRDAVLGSLAAAVAEAEPEGVIRPFLDEGAPMATLLANLHMAARDGREPVGSVPAYLGTLLAAFPGKEQGRHRTGLIEPLSARELEVLRLLAAGGSNAELAAKLFVEQSTVKTHLYNKLGVTAGPRRSPAPARSGCWTDPAPGSTLRSTLRWTRPTSHAVRLTARRSPDRGGTP
jgi:DNA-binding CsgD family transcriptional regulator